MKNKIIAYLILSTALALFCSPVWSENVEEFPLKENGSIPVWLTAGPLPINPPMDTGQIAAGGFYKDFLRQYGGESQFIPVEGDALSFPLNGETNWQTAISDAHGVLDFLQIFNSNMTERGVAYAFCELNASKDRDVMLKIRSNDGVRVWVNQDLVHDLHVGRSLEQQEDRIRVSLKKGKNRILVKVDQLGGGWGLSVQVAHSDSTPVKEVSSSVILNQTLRGRLSKAEFIHDNIVIRTPEGVRQNIRANIVSGGLDNLRCRIESEEWEQPVEINLGEIPFGNHTLELSVPPITTAFRAILTTQEGKKHYRTVSCKPVREWTVYLVQHVHTDIGYTRPQTEILAEHLRFIDYALDYCDLTDHYPDDAQFHWTCEITWAVREYIKRRPPEQVRRLIRRIQEGRIEIAGMFLNMSDIATESALAASLQPIHLLSEKHGIPVRTAMQNDVNGAAWCLVDYFSGLGVDYLTMGINKTRSLLPFDRPTVFWWESPSGKRILAFRADHYHTPNLWKIHEGDVERFKPGLLGHLQFLEDKGYPFDRIAINFSGYHTDNSPPATIGCDLVKEWNERYVWPHLKLTTAHEFAGYIKSHHADTLPVYRAAWPDWWTDGFGSAARETSEARATHTEMQVTDSLLAMAALLGADISEETMVRESAVHDALLFYDEHTYGAAESIHDPMAENSMIQWGEKSSYVWEAVKSAGMLREEAWGLIQTYLPRDEVSTISVFNTLNWERSGLVEVFIDHEILPRDKGFRIIDPISGEAVPAQIMSSRSEGSYWALWTQNIPAMGYKIYRIEANDRPRKSPRRLPGNVTRMENEYYALSIDRQSGAISELIDKRNERNLVDPDAPWNLGQLIYETMDKGREFHRDAFKRNTVRNVQIHPESDGPIWKSIVIDALLDGSERVRMEVRLYSLQKQITLHYSIRKNPITQAEALYVAFPLDIPDSRILYEAQGGIVEPGKNQIPRSSSDWQSIQNFISVHSGEGQLIFVSPQIPLVQLGDLNLGKWQEMAVIEKPYIYSWVMNNYWFTNFRASQEGELKWEYHLTTTSDSDLGTATQIGWSARIPLVARVFPSGQKSSRNAKSSVSFLHLDHPNLLVVDARPSRYGDGIILQLREIKGETTTLDVKQISGIARIQSVDLVNVIEAPIQEHARQITLDPYSVQFIKLRSL